MSKTTLRQAENVVFIEGLLLENRLEFSEHDGNNIIRGEVDIEVAENEVHTVSFYATELTKDKKENGIYKSLSTVIEEYKSVASVGREEADKVRITSGELRLNEYYGQDGMLRSFPQISSNFINRLRSNEKFSPKATFKVEAVVDGIREEIKNDEETGRAILKVYIPLYGGRIIPFEFIVADESAIRYIADNYEKGSTVKIYGDVINYKEVIEKEEPVAFGKPQKKITTTTIREFIITGGSEPYDEENKDTYDLELIKKALAEREIYLEGLKNKKEKNEKNEVKKGFDIKTSSKDHLSIDADDLPF